MRDPKSEQRRSKNGQEMANDYQNDVGRLEVFGDENFFGGSSIEHGF
jgi:hypothetical protein